MASNSHSGETPSQIHDAGAEETISPALRRRLQSCFERGQKLAAEKDYDYAHEMFAECAAKDPSNLVYVEAMMDNLQLKYNNNKKGARIKGFGGRGAFKKAIGAKDWREVLRVGIDLLKSNPWDTGTLRPMAQACQALHYNEVELRYLKNALDANPKDVEVNRHCAFSLARMGQFDQAIACWHRIEELSKGNTEAPKMISQLTLQKTRHSGTVGEDISAPAGISPSPSHNSSRSTPPKHGTEQSDQAQAESKEAKVEIPLNTRQKLEKAISDNPENVDNYVQLAQWHTQQEHFREAEQVLTRALAASGNDFHIREQLENAQMRHARSQLAIAERRAQSNESSENQALARRLRVELNRMELEIFGARSQRHPENIAIQYELGVRLKRAGNYSESIRQLEQITGNARVEALAALELGECFQQTRQYQKALDHYVRAVDAMDTGDTEHRKLAMYRAGTLAAGLKDIKNATKYLTAVLQQDPNYRDAQARLDKLEEIGDK